MASTSSLLIKLFAAQLLLCLCCAHGYDFFFFVQQWPGSACDRKRSCCYPTSGKPAVDFSIHGLWPIYRNHSFPSNCDRHNRCDESKISDLTGRLLKSWPTLACPTNNGSKFWAHEWMKHGTCSEAVLDQHAYFKSALDIKDKVDLLQVLQNAGIYPDGRFYKLSSIREAIEEAIGHTPVIECNTDALGNVQLYQLYLCVDASGSNLIECPWLPKRKCASEIEFPYFGPTETPFLPSLVDQK